jgi:hypothetical protein
MAVIRFTLDGPSVLDDELFGLDGPSAFILDASILDGDRVLDGGQFLTTATGTATLGALSATATSTVAHFVTASAELGELVAEVAQIIVTTEATGEAQLGALVASATATVVLPATASANLGGLVASAVTAVEQDAVATANLGGLVATADTAPTPPEPEPTPGPSGGRRVYSTTPRKKIEPLPEVKIPVIEPKRRYAVVSTSLNGMQAQATSTITFSILDDDAEVLLLV